VRNSYPTQRVGNGALVQKRIVSTVFCRVGSIIGYNNGADVFMQVHETGVEPAVGAVPAFHCLADTLRSWAIALPNPVEMSACTVVASTTLDTYTPAGGTPVTIQVLLAV
jgi:hypothetical protein